MTHQNAMKRNASQVVSFRSRKQGPIRVPRSEDALARYNPNWDKRTPSPPLLAVFKQHDLSAFARYVSKQGVQEHAELIEQVEQELEDHQISAALLREHAGDEVPLAMANAGIRNSALYTSLNTSASLERKRARLLSRASYNNQEALQRYNHAISRFEDVSLALISLSKSNSVSHALVIFMQYIKTFMKGSLLNHFERLALDVLEGFAFTAQDGLDKTNKTRASNEPTVSGSNTRVFESLRNFIGNWKMFREGPLAEHVCKLVSLLSLAQLVPELQTVIDPFNGKTIVDKSGTGINPETGDFMVRGYEVFSAKILNTQKDCVDIVEMGLSTILFFLERGWQAFVSKDPTALLYTDSELVDIEAEYTILISAIPLLDSGRLSHLMHPHVESIKDENDYSLRLEALTKKLINATKSSAATVGFRAALGTKIARLAAIKVKLINAQQSKALRVRPFAVEIEGGTAAAKSTVNDAVIAVISKVNDFPTGVGTKVTMNESDQYESEMTAGTVAVTIDDMANTKQSKIEGNPSIKIIEYVNNITRNATKAELESKGNVPVQMKILTVTTNKLDLDVAAFSNEPASVLRRFNEVLRVRLKESHKNDEGGFDPNAFERDRDAWEIDIGRWVVKPSQRTGGTQSHPSEYELRVSHKNASLSDTLKHLSASSVKHFEEQNRLITQLEENADAPLCPHGITNYVCPECNVCQRSVAERASEYVSSASESDEESESPSIEAALDEIDQHDALHCEELRAHEGMIVPVTLMTMFLSTIFFINHVIKQSLHTWQRGLARVPLRPAQFADVWRSNAYGQAMRTHVYWKVSAVALLQTERVRCTTRRIAYRACDTITEAFLRLYENEELVLACLTFLTIASVTYASKKFLGYELTRTAKVPKEVKCDEETVESSIPDVTQRSELLEHQGVGVPEPEPFDEREDVWKKVEKPYRPRTLGTKGLTIEQLRTKCLRHIHKSSNRTTNKWCNIFPLYGNYWMVPTHHVPEEKKYNLYISHKPIDMLGKNVECIVSPQCWYRIPNTDFTVLQLPQLGSVTDMVKFMPEEVFRCGQFEAEMVNKSQTLFEEKRMLSVKQYFPDLKTPTVKQSAYLYTSSEDFYEGMCMAPLMTHSRCPMIVGFHLYGYSPAPTKGVAGSITAGQIREAIIAIGKRSRFGAVCEGDFPTEQLGVTFGTDTPVHARSVVRFQKEENDRQPSGEVIGAHNGPRMNPRSHVRASPISESVSKAFGTLNKWAAPRFKEAKKYWNQDMAKMMKPSCKLDPEIFELAFSDLERKYDEIFTDEICAKLAPFSWDVVASGADGIHGVNRMELSTSTGFPLNKKKSDFATVGQKEVPGITEVVEFDDLFYEQIAKMEECYLKGERAYPIFRACLKDEPTLKTKEKIRVFTSGPICLSLMVRKYFLPLTRVEHHHWEEMGSCVGINAHGPDWTKLKKRLHKFGSNKYICGDYSKYDKMTSAMMVRAALDVYIRMARKCPAYSVEDILIMTGLATDICYPVYDYDGTFVQLWSSLCSGIPITVEANGMQGQAYLRYAYYDTMDYDLLPTSSDYVLRCNLPDFDQIASAFVYGDDNAVEVSDDCPEFTHTAVQKSLAKIGMKYTMADKEAASVPYIPFSEVSFLKRGFVDNEELGETMAPLEEDSIMRSLHNYMEDKRSDTLATEISKQSVEGAMAEYFRHGKEVYNDRLQKMQKVVAEHSFLSNAVLMSYEKQLEHYRGRYLEGPSTARQFSMEVHNLVCQDGDEMCFAHDGGIEPMSDEPECLLVEHAGDESAVDEQPVSNMKQEVATFAESSPGWDAEATGWDPTRQTVRNNDTDLQNFFKRPIQIDEFTWAPDVEFTALFNPWTAFMENPRVQNRLNNFRLLQAELHVRFLLSGGPFSQGRMLCSYAPFSNTRGLPYSRLLIRNDIIQESQRMHIYLNPTNSTGGDMTLPFFVPEDSLDVLQGTWDQLGEITMRTMNQLRHVNGATNTVSITVLAWAENVSLEVPTTFSSNGLQPQDGDEYGEGAISKPASNVAKIASMLTNVPYIGPFAMAAEIGAKATSAIASKFGYCKPTNIASEMPYVPRYFGNMTSLEGEDTGVKLSADPKQALTVDPRVTGINSEDEMAISKMAAIESYVTTFDYPFAATPDTLLFSMKVTPDIFTRNFAGEVHMTPASAVAKCFNFWRGTVCIRLMIVASNYQRGRLRIVYEPGPTTPATVPEYNTAYQDIIDIAAVHDRTYEIGWGNPEAYLEVQPLNPTTLVPFNTGPVVGSGQEMNGTLSVYVMSNLTTPDSELVGVEVNVLTCMKEDCMFAAPTVTNVSNLSVFVPQDGFEFPDDFAHFLVNHEGIEGVAHEHAASPSEANSVVKFSSLDNNPNLNKVYFGEQIVSIRALVKRYCYIRTDSINRVFGQDVNDPSSFAHLRAALFGFRGFDPQGEDLTDAGDPYNYHGVTFMHWFLPMFGGWRGGIRFKVIPGGDLTGLGADIKGPIGIIRVARTRQRGIAIVSNVDSNESKIAQRDLYNEMGDGGELQPMSQRGIVEAEVPFMLNKRFAIARRTNFSDTRDTPGMVIISTSRSIQTNGKQQHNTIFMAAADDFSLLFFQGVPPLYEYDDPA